MNIALIGLGEFGRAIASLLEYNGHEYEYAEKGKLLTKPADVVFLTVPTQFLRQALEDNKQWLSEKTLVVNCIKGIEEDSHLLVHQIVESIGNFPRYYALMGPSFAKEVIRKNPTIVSLGYIDARHRKKVMDLVQTPYFRVEPIKGFRAIELASALKNVYAILCGYANGMGFGQNTEAKLITLALQEFETLAAAMGYKHFDCAAPAVVGDMVLTCTSDQSRNYRFGRQLARKKSVKVSDNDTVEGYHTSHSIQALCEQYKVQLPLATLTAEIIGARVETEAEFRKFLAIR